MKTIKAAWTLHYAPIHEADTHPWHWCYGESLDALQRSSSHVSEEDALKYMATHLSKVVDEVQQMAVSTSIDKYSQTC